MPVLKSITGVLDSEPFIAHGFPVPGGVCMELLHLNHVEPQPFSHAGYRRIKVLFFFFPNGHSTSLVPLVNLSVCSGSSCHVYERLRFKIAVPPGPSMFCYRQISSYILLQ
jgi:hypothetical protein